MRRLFVGFVLLGFLGGLETSVALAQETPEQRKEREQKGLLDALNTVILASNRHEIEIPRLRNQISELYMKAEKERIHRAVKVSKDGNFEIGELEDLREVRENVQPEVIWKLIHRMVEANEKDTTHSREIGANYHLAIRLAAIFSVPAADLYTNKAALGKTFEVTKQAYGKTESTGVVIQLTGPKDVMTIGSVYDGMKKAVTAAPKR